MIAIMWQFDVKAGRETEFEQLYGADGAWTAMNRHTRSYIGSSFLNDQNLATRYIVIEYWSEMLVSEPARGVRSTALAEFEAKRTALIESVEPMGIFTALNVPDRFGRHGHNDSSCIVEQPLEPERPSNVLAGMPR